MTVVSVDPDGTTSNTGALTGGATAHAVLADSSDSTYVTFEPGELAKVTFADPTIPAGAVVKASSVVARSASVLGLTAQETRLTVGTETKVTTSAVTTLQQYVAAVVSGNEDTDAASATVKNPLGSISGADLNVYKLRLDVIYVAVPTLTVDAPTGTLTEDNRPTVEWTNTLDSDGGPQWAAGVKIFTEAQYTAGGFDADTSTPFDSESFFGAATSWRGSKILPNGDYRAYVQVSQIFGASQTIESDWTYEEFTIDVPAPAAPSVVAGAESTATPAPRIRLEITANTGTVTTDAVDVEYQATDGTWLPLRTTDDGRVVTLPRNIYDFEAPNGVARNYRVRAVHSYTESETYSTWSVAVATLDAPQWTIHHPTSPLLSLTCDLRSFPGHSRAARQSVKQPLGRADAVVISDTRGPQTGAIVIRCPDDATRDAVMALATASVPLLFTPPAGHHEPQRWMSLGDEDITRLVDKSWIDERDATYQWTEVIRPEGDIDIWPGGLYPSPTLLPSEDLLPSG